MVMLLQKTEKINGLIHTALLSEQIDSSVKHQLHEYSEKECIPYQLVKIVCLKLQEEKEEGPWIHEVCRGSELVLTPPAARKRSPELIARLEKLQHQVDEAAYQKMVQNVAQGDNADDSFTLLPTFRLQLSFGAHVLLTMFVFYLLGSYATRAISDRPGFHALGGAIGLTFGLILETTLFIVRSIPLRQSSSEHSTSKDKDV